MRLRHWLLTGTSLGLLALAPAGIARAQDAALQAAYENYISAASSDDADAKAAAEAEFQAACSAAGIGSIQECISSIQNGGAPAAAPAEEPAPAPEAAPAEPAPAEEPAPAPEPEAAPAEEPAPAAEPAPEQPAAEAPAPAPEAAPEPAPEQPAAEPAPAPAEEPAPEPAPAAEQPAAPEPAPAEPAAEQPAEQQPAPAAEQPAEQQPAPAEQQPAAPAADISGDLNAAVGDYQNGVAALIEAQTSGADVTAAQGQIADAKARIDTLCAQGGFASTDECLANFGLNLPKVPANLMPAEQAPAEQPAAEQPATEQPAAEQPAAEQPTPPPPEQVQKEIEASPVLTDQPTEDVTNLPADVKPEEVAPLLDSAKDEVTNIETGVGPTKVAAPVEEAAPPPADDAAAQAKLNVAPEEIKATAAEEGQQLDAPPPVVVPQNVTVINNTTTNVVNNVTNNNTTVNNNTNGNNQPGRPQPGGRPQQPQQPADLGQIIFQIGTQLVITNPQQERDRFIQPDDQTYYEQLSGGRVRETVERPDGSKVVTIRNRYGEVLQRSRITPDGREYVLAYYDPRADREDEDLFYRDPGADLPPLRLNIPVNQYVIDARNSNEQQIATFFEQPPVEQVRRLYTIDEVKRSARIRDSVRRLEVGNLTFDTGAATISRDQVASLGDVAAAMQALLKRNPAETFLIEGHTDAVGSDLSNLKLSDLRANTVARILSDFYDIPPENLATQGYGERYLKVKTQAAERENRRVTIRRITPLITPVASR